MRPSKYLIAIFIVFLAAPVSAQDADELPRLKTEGNKFTTADGTPISLRGVSLCSIEWHAPLKQIETIGTEWKVNIVRLPVQPREWDRYGPAKYMKDKLDPAVALCKKHGFYCIIDWHEISDWDKPDKVKRLEQFWQIVAPRYAANPNILYEVFNEPVGPKKKDKENWLAFRTKMQGWVDQIRESAPRTVLLIGSPHWSQMTSFAAKDPLDGDNLGYVAHIYPNYKPASWDKAFGEAAQTVPVFLSEWGWSTGEKAFYVIKGTQKDYGEPMKAYLNERPHIGWTAWSYDPKCAPAMTGKDQEMGAFVKEWLEESNP